MNVPWRHANRNQYLAEYDRGDGRVWAYHTDAEPELDPHGEVVAVFGVTRNVSRQRNAEIEAERSRQMLERAQAIGRMGHWRIDAQTGKLFWSPTMYQMFGFQTDEAISIEAFLALVDPDQLPEIRRIRQQGMAHHTTIAYAADLTLRDGTRLFIETIGEPEFDGSGQLIGYFGVTQDVTERVSAQRGLASTEMRLQRIFDAMDKAGIGVGIQNSDGEIAAARPALLNIAGFEREEEVLGRRWSDLQGDSGDDLLGALDGVLERARRGESSSMQNVELEWGRPDGRTVPVLLRLAPMPEGDRAIIVMDQTIQKQAQAELAAREARMQSILTSMDQSGIGYAVEDIEGRIITVSPKLAALLDIDDPDSLLGQRWTSVFTLPEEVLDRISAENEAYRSLEMRSFVYPDFELALQSGEKIYLHGRSTPLPGIGRLVLTMDVTERHRLEAARKEMEANLQKIQKMEALGALAGGVAHELNNMLHPIRTFAKAALTADDTATREHRIGRVLDCADKATDIVRKVLTFARSEGAETARLSVSQMARKAVGFSRDLSLGGIEIELDMPAEELFIQGNETEFTQILLNLLQNASDAMQARGIIVVRLEQQGGSHALLSVTDDGEGMPAEVADRVFEPFFTTKPQGAGTGLGLSVVYGIINRWGGTIDLESQPGKGTSVRISLPLADEPGE